MEISGWILFAVIFWVFGYSKTKYFEPSDGKFVYVPRWVYLIICGLPRTKDLPQETVSIIGLRAQISGWVLLVYGLFARHLILDELLSFVVGFVISLFLGFGLAYLISRN
jgi:hypothetical protein